MALITTRETAGTNATVKDSPLTNGELDNTLIAINDEGIANEARIAALEGGRNTFIELLPQNAVFPTVAPASYEVKEVNGGDTLLPSVRFAATGGESSCTWIMHVGEDGALPFADSLRNAIVTFYSEGTNNLGTVSLKFYFKYLVNDALLNTPYYELTVNVEVPSSSDQKIVSRLAPLGNTLGMTPETTTAMVVKVERQIDSFDQHIFLTGLTFNLDY